MLLLLVQGRAKNLAKLSDTCSVRADGLCIGCPRLVGRKKAGNSNRLEFFLHHAVWLMAIFGLRKEDLKSSQAIGGCIDV